ncbi:hypothetical protein C0991_008840 [Blastosporella zonata]|nr:hypothetical protein C0991_008840 [Blastosporella zonata]
MTDATDLPSAIEAILIASKKVKLTTDLENSIEQLNSISKLLEFFAPSSAVLQRLISLLRDSLLPLYKTFPILGIRYAVALLTTIFESKTLPALNNRQGNLVTSWEAVQASLLSGILGFLELYSSSENRTIVANSLYPILRSVFFLRANSTFQAGPDLMYILYGLLSETVTSHPTNQAELRNQDVLGGVHIGAILSKCQNILVIEGLLELFIKLLPSKSQSVEARTKFIHDAFGPAHFACSAAIIKTLETAPPTADWEAVFVEIVNLLGEADPAFPQSFKIYNFHVKDEKKSYNVERLYVDPLGFVANIDEGDQIETLHALYTSVQNLKVIVLPSKEKAHITILFSPPPAVGETTITTSVKGATVTFEIDAQEVTRLLTSLKLRDVNIDQYGKKLSKAEESLILNYDSHRKGVISTQDKGRDLARLWDLSNSQPQAGQVLTTSPLIQAPNADGSDRSPPVMAILTLPLIATPIQGSIPEISSPYYDSIFGSTDEELTDLSDAESKSTLRRSSRQSRPSHKARPDVPESEDEVLVMRKVKSNRKTVVLSDNETDGIKSPLQKADEIAQSDLHTSTPTKTRSLRSKPILKSLLRPSTVQKENITPYKPTVGVTKKGVKHASKSNISSRGIHPPDSWPSPVKDHPRAARKRKSAVDDIPDINGPGFEGPSSKRLRASPRAGKDIPGPKPPKKPKRYGRKGRTSSPNPPSSNGVDFDELPAPSTDTFPKSEEKRTRVSAMKDRGGKLVRTKARTVKKKLKDTKEENSDTLPKKGNKLEREAKSAQIESETPMIEAIEYKIPNTTVAKSEPPRRSARVAKIPKVPVTTKQAPKMEPHSEAPPAIEPSKHHEDENAIKKRVGPQKKPSRAPWTNPALKDVGIALSPIHDIAATTDGPVVEDVVMDDIVPDDIVVEVLRDATLVEDVQEVADAVLVVPEAMVEEESGDVQMLDVDIVEQGTVDNQPPPPTVKNIVINRAYD